jgi:hypothetical protein
MWIWWRAFGLNDSSEWFTLNKRNEIKYYSARETASFTRIIPHSLTFLISNSRRCNTNSGTQAVKTAQNSQSSKSSNGVLLTLSRALRVVKSVRGHEACNLVTAAITVSEEKQSMLRNVTHGYWFGAGWIRLTQDSDQWWALVSIVMNLRVP